MNQHDAAGLDSVSGERPIQQRLIQLAEQAITPDVENGLKVGELLYRESLQNSPIEHAPGFAVAIHLL